MKAALALLESLSAGNFDRQGFVAREMNRSGKLDALLGDMRAAGAVGDGDVLEACCAVNDAILARAHAKTVLRDVIYPKMVRIDPKSSGGEVLLYAENGLRAANSPDDVNDALGLAIRHFKTKSDRLGRHGYKKFAAALEACLMKIA